VIFIQRNLNSAPDIGFQRPNSFFQPWTCKTAAVQAKKSHESLRSPWLASSSTDQCVENSKIQKIKSSKSRELRSKSPAVAVQACPSKPSTIRYKVPSVKDATINRSSANKTKDDAYEDKALSQTNYLTSMMSDQGSQAFHSTLRAISRGTKPDESHPVNLNSVVRVHIAKYYTKPQTGTQQLGTGQTLTQNSLVSVKPEVTKCLKRKTVNILGEHKSNSKVQSSNENWASSPESPGNVVFVHRIATNAGETRLDRSKSMSKQSPLSIATQASEGRLASMSAKRLLESSSIRALCTKPDLQTIPGVPELGSLGLLAKHPLQFKAVKQGPHVKGNRGHEISGGAKHGYCRQPNGGFFNK
jgi:hypothetical protein